MTWLGELPPRHQVSSLAGNPDRPAQVLLVEDDTGFAFALRESLVVGEHAAPLQVDHAGSLRAALDALRARSSDIILLDLTLPDAHGLAAIHEILSAAPSTPIVVLTGHDDDALALQVMQAGAQDYLVKGQMSGRLLRRAIRYAIEHKRLEEALRWSDQQLRQAQKMEAVGRLVGGVAHDFNSMLTIILSYSELMLQQLAEHDPNRHGLKEVWKAGLKAADLVGQLLAFSRQQVLQPQILDLNDIVGDLARILRRLIGEDIELVTAPGKELGLVKADPSQIEQVLLNLVVNARDAMSRGGKLTIETGNVDLLPLSIPLLDLPAGAYVMLAVSDTGVGISPAIQPRIFEPFFTTKAPGKGTGLGLATVYGITKQSGGTSWSTASRAKARRSRSTCRATSTAVWRIRTTSSATRPPRPAAPKPSYWSRTRTECARSRA